MRGKRIQKGRVKVCVFRIKKEWDEEWEEGRKGKRDEGRIRKPR